MRFAAAAAIACLSLPAVARAQAESRPTIQVTGYGRVSTPPDMAFLSYSVAGEGRTSDEATAALAARQRAIVDGARAFLGGRTQVLGGNVSVVQTRGANCKANGGYGAQPTLSEGDCAVTGYIATLDGAIRTSTVAKAGSLAALVSHLGARDARLQSFSLSDDRPAKQQAIAEAVADARSRAEALAAASHARLGPPQSIRDSNSEGDAIPPLPVPPPPPPPPPPGYQPPQIEITPRPIETRAQVYVTYVLEP